MGELDLALSHYRASLEIEPALPFSNMRMAYVFERLGRLELARAHAGRELAVNPSSGEARAFLRRLK